ncbi:Putative serine/threonine-protein kinase haspin-like [Papilio xuthus]|uniref:non-specific serine/threonine protein kinase n=1 Tax=Papilio xuthus TaxID=66420 RepID=A0A194QIE7_PAPXU|nr:Putative serine/threonine-protein kinase haspin-like [Papilio xuthus]
MRRTYRSKKDDGSIDHKKLISRIDCRSSAFDAFYIHNIKLNKKEISSSACSNQINLASKKIRKRKYVKRIVNDGSQRKLPHPGEPESQSVLLTPDKSIHVNKAPDQFDLLLRSSPTFTKSPILVHKLSESLNINRKTKYNCSVDCADWDNVNAIKVKSSCSNTSDVKSHKLIVEVEDTSECKCHDESIRRIVKHMPLLNNINNPHLKSIKNNHRLTATQQNSPAAANSPLCSTPFQLKHRCQSIFNISPISINFKDSPKVVMNTFKASSSDDEYENKSQCETSVKIQSLRVTNVINCEGNQAASKDLTIVQQKSLSLESEILHTLSTSEVEPCYGFAKPSEPDYNTDIENGNSRASLCPTTAYEDLKGFLSDDCDDTIVDLSKLSIGESVHEVTVVENFHEASRIATARDYVLRRCNQTEPLLFDECYPDTALKNCHKIGEGVYGEVFLWRARDGEARVLKVIPIAGDIKVNGEPQKGYDEIISEIVIAMELSALRAPIPDIEKRLDEGKELDSLDLLSVENATDIFNEVLAVRCVRGAYPARLLELWELYDECHGSDNDNPGALPTHQHYLVLELRNAGRDLESYSFTGADQAYAVLLQLAFGLAVAEEALQFEHRDLHWGNVLVAPTDQEYATFLLRGRVHRVPRRGAACVVIDYSLSRVSLRGAALYADLADDDSLFEAVGDRQFDVYRLMRDRLGNEWKNFEPYTNVLWLHYVADKMVTALRYERPATKLHRHYLGRLRAARRALLAHASAADFVLAHAHAAL